jgi:hypothetical protein
MQHVALAGPLVIGGALKIGYDLLYTARFVMCVRRRRKWSAARARRAADVSLKRPEPSRQR